MPTTSIAPKAPVTTLINVFTVEPERQRELVDLLEQATEQIMRHRPGFVSANIHASLDGERVVNYAQWRSREEFDAMLADPQAREHMAEISAVAHSDPKIYEVTSVHHG